MDEMLYGPGYCEHPLNTLESMHLFCLISVEIAQLSEPMGSECYTGINSIHHLRFPFSLHFLSQLDTFCTYYQTDTAKLTEDKSNYHPDTGTHCMVNMEIY